MKTNIVKFIGFLVANICHDEQEWNEWAVPFIELLLRAQNYSKEEQKNTLTIVNEMFVTLFGSRTKLVCEEGDGFIVLHVGSVWWEEACAQDQLEEELSEFLNNYIVWTTTSGVYDARARVIAKRVYYLLQTPEKFTELENRIRGSSEEAVVAAKTKAKVEAIAEAEVVKEEGDDVIMSNSERFQLGNNVHSKSTRNKPFSSDITGGNVTERIWKVSLAATVGASIMSVAAVSTGPAIVGAIIATLGDSTLAQFFVGMTAILTSYGVTSSSVLGTLGAYTATMKMLHRTEPLKEFRIAHLHRRPGRLQAVEVEGLVGSRARFMKPDSKASYGDLGGSGGVSSNAPIYLLVPGHCNYIPASESSASGIASSVAESITGPYKIQSDRDVWGADPSPMSDMEILEPEADGAVEGTASILGNVTTIIDYFKPSTSSAPANTDGGAVPSSIDAKTAGSIEPVGTEPHVKRTASTSPPAKVEFLFETDNRYGSYDTASPKLLVTEPSSSSSSAIGSSADGSALPTSTQTQTQQLKSIIKNAEPLKPEAFTGNEINKNWDFVSYENVHHGWWGDLVKYGDEYLLQWDRSTRDHLSRSLHEYISSKGVNYLTHELLMLTPAATLLTATVLPWPLNMMHKSLNEIDNPWSIAIEKSRKAGQLLAITLMMQHEAFVAEHKRTQRPVNAKASKMPSLAKMVQSTSIGTCLPVSTQQTEGEVAAVVDTTASIREQLMQVLSSDKDIQAVTDFIVLKKELEPNSGTDATFIPSQRRPITLIGYGIGARVIVHCLEALVTEYKQYANKDFIRGLVENVVLMGTPYGTNSAAWKELRSIIPGRFINCYSTRDWLLALMFRQCTWELGVAGLSPIDLSSSDCDIAPIHHTHVHAHTDPGSPDTASTTTSIPTPAPVATVKADTSSNTVNGDECDDSSVFSIENVNITALIRSHADYPNALQLIIPLLHLEE